MPANTTGAPGHPYASPIALLTTLLATACSTVGAADQEYRPEGAPPTVVTAEEAARGAIDDRDIGAHVAFLAHDSRHGRATPSPGLERSAAWIAEQFQRAGLIPAGDAGGYLQYWPYEGAGTPADSMVQVPNVVGRLAGNDLTRAGEYVLLVAHYDHLGVDRGETGDTIYNGADDNASGVVALVELAQAFAVLDPATARPVVFLATSGKERGLLGSAWYARHPTVQLEGAVAVLNLDAVGRNAGDSIAVVGYDYSTLGPLVGDVAAAHDWLGLSVDPAPDAGPAGSMDRLYRQGDQWPFARLGIPAIRFFSGFHDDYHAPGDEAGKVSTEKVARVARLVFLTAHRLADSELRPEWTEAAAPVRR